jgi:hypothetical protein
VTGLVETLGTRRRLAARAAVDAANRLEDGGERSPAEQLRLEEALGDFRHYGELYESLRPLADELHDYRRDGESLLRDMWNSRRGDKSATRRLLAHARATGSDALTEQRDVGGSSVVASVPLWLEDDAAPLSTATAPLVRMLAKPLPPGTSGSVNLVRWVTPPTAAAQNGMNGTLTTPSIAEGTAGPGVRTYATRAKLSIQLLEQGSIAVDAQLLPAMLAAIDAQIDADLISADGTAGTVLGIRSTSGISSGTYTDASPTAAELWPIVEGTVRACEIGMGGSPLVVCAPRRLSWLRQRAVVEPVAAFDFDAPTVPGATTRVLGTMNIVSDCNVPTALGAGSNEDVLLVVRSTDCLDLFVGPPRVQFGDVDNLQVYVNVWKQVAFTAARLPAAVGVVGGTGLVAPTP